MFSIAGVCRVFLPSPLVLLATDFVMITYRVFINSGLSSPVQSFPTYNATGWPHTYDLTTISSNGNTISATVVGDHHYEVGDTLLIQNSTPTQIPLTSITSDGSTVSVVSSGHGFAVSDSIDVLGTDNYDGNYIVTSVIDADNFTIDSGINETAETSGFVHATTPSTFYNQEFVVSGVPAPNQLELASSLNEAVTNNGVISVPNTGFTFTDNSTNGYHRAEISNLTGTASGINSTEIFDRSIPFGSNIVTEIRRNDADWTQINAVDDSGQGLTSRVGVTLLATRDYGRIRQFRFGGGSGTDFYITFDHIQTKKALYSLTLFVELAHLQELN